MAFNIGTGFGPYEITAPLGAGGMGEVYRATDSRLNRDVAVKVLPDSVATDANRLARFQWEAQVLAALNHSNIAQIYGLENFDDHQAIILELVEGETLAERIERGAIPIEEAREIALQIAEAFEVAHEKGIIHRDLKPANIKITPEGTVKVLDFGLAKALAPEMSADPASASLSPTVTSAGTIAGTLLGTAAYMSPEQAKGRPVDRRADIWAFGVVLYEMLTGKKLFEAETVSETMAAVLRDDVSMDTLPGGIPASVRTLLKRCLDREPRTRLRDIGEARIALSPESLTAGGPAGEPAASTAAGASSRGRHALPWVLVTLLSVVAAFSLWKASSGPAEESELLTLVAPIPDDLRLPADQMGIMALSPDGKTLALVLAGDTDKMLYVRKLDSAELVQMPGTQDAATPFFSPDGRWIAFFADNKLKKVPVGGGAPVTLCNSDGSNRGADWGTDDVIVFSPHYTRPLMRVSGAGGEPTVLTAIDKTKGERTHRWPQAVPGEDLVLFTVGTMDSPESYDDARIEAIRPSTGEQHTVLKRASMARYVPSGHLVFGREGFLFAVRFDLDSLEVRGSPVPILEEVMGMRSSGVVHVGFARNGLLAYIAGAPRSRQSRLVWRSRDGGSEFLPAPVAGYLNPRISPDRTQIAVQVEGATTFDISIYHIRRETLTRLTFEGDNTVPAWSPDGRRIAFASVRNNALMSAYMKAVDGSGQAEMVYYPERIENSGSVVPFGWTPDGKSLIMEFTNENANNLATFSEDSGEAKVILETPAAEGSPALSPNGRWLAYTSDEAGEFQIFVRAYLGPGGKWQISTSGGLVPKWSPDGKELFYRLQNKLYSVVIDDSSGSFRAGRPEVVFDDLSTVSANYDYDVFNSNRFLMVENAGDDPAPAGVTVVVNWLDELARRVPD
ncbi:MAG: protein kinase [Gammaproteobacteria bacterium]|nr:protein kinase [Gammaproteobacteria bacterium]